MQAVFVNTLEKQLGEGRVAQGRVSIGEEQGLWHVVWEEGDKERERWYAGTSWEEMLSTFRYSVAIKLGEGYVPVLDGMLEERKPDRGMRGALSRYHCYGELHSDPELFEALRDWRRGRAIAEKKAAYVIATNRMLWMLSAYVPHQEDELLQIPGWGENKHGLYGAEVLEITRRYAQRTAFPLDWVAEALDTDTYTQWMYRQKEMKFKGELDRHQEKRRLLEGIQDGLSLAELQQSTELPRRELLERIETLEAEGYDLEALIERELAEVSQEEQQKIWQALASVGDRYLKPVLSEVYEEQELKTRQVEVLYDRLRLMRIRYRRAGQSESQAI
ncbi:HRDC domain-containing protein [Paenibacillus sp. IB182496]|uniref:HRDC domain-containing protein n=1 Tax=Paenibacillus sabuli TaxID=2772509 RepID=A0A927BZ27_9BACL|nr:HRDC domain-containing protein [Paenibacillus sabuli]MBD2848034.1 HRDC domain-containing protein [Paenibacillus sabuli]